MRVMIRSWFRRSMGGAQWTVIIAHQASASMLNGDGRFEVSRLGESSMGRRPRMDALQDIMGKGIYKTICISRLITRVHINEIAV
ncbi:hypothetical protein PLICRDRAFT_591092 [Plicaturopsis crispa FD-325 SS-3]|nr:hypothetical protein PLICRDRAFT_591092 [Plicaturopsis crispa FD-325 SS-3]